MEKTTNNIDKKLKELFTNTSFECYQHEGFECATELIEAMRQEISEDEVIYYSKAIEYLSNNDASLKESMSIANNLGYSCKDINSELLATLLQQQNLNEELNGLEEEIIDIFNGDGLADKK